MEGNFALTLFAIVTLSPLFVLAGRSLRLYLGRRRQVELLVAPRHRTLSYTMSEAPAASALAPTPEPASPALTPGPASSALTPEPASSALTPGPASSAKTGVPGSTHGIVVPEGYTLHTENGAHILISSRDEVFLNPVQEFNRDLSVACIRVWSEETEREREARWRRAQERRRARRGEEAVVVERAAMGVGGETERGGEDHGAPSRAGGGDGKEKTVRWSSLRPCCFSRAHTLSPPQYRPHRFVLLEALSATGLRAIRYAKEISLLR